MTPEMYDRAKVLFAEAIALPESERNAFVKLNSKGNDALRDEVLSLLRHHIDKSLIETTDIGKQETNAGENADARLVPSVRRHSVGRVGVGDPSELSRRFNEATLTLLRSRLISAVYLILVILVSITLFGLSTGSLTASGIAIRGFVFLILGAILWVLRSSKPLHQRRLRWLETAVIAVPMFELMFIMVRGTDAAMADGRPEDVLALRAMISTAVSIYIAIYGILIPASWQRTAIITGLAALLPTAVALVHRWVSGGLETVEFMHFANPMLTLLMAMVATTGAHLVHRVRREAEAARLYGQYRLNEEIGRGAMGIVYRAEHKMLKRPAAIKLIRQEEANNEEAISRFEAEVQISATLSHWNTVEIYDYGRTENGDFYYVMEYLRGESLRDRLTRETTLSLPKAIATLMQTCDGLADAHRRGFVHRDIKPSNLFLAEIGGEQDIVKIVDFGIATTISATTQGAAKRICGTPRYMSPEQIRGDPLDGRSDQYAIGCVAIECVTGSPPFVSPSMSQLLSDHLFKIPRFESVEQIDHRFADVLKRCLAKRPAERFETVADLKFALSELL